MLKTSIENAAVFWSGKKISHANKRLKEFSISMEDDTYLIVVLGETDTPIEEKKLSISVGENGKLIINEEVYETGYDILSFAESQIVGLEVKPDIDYFFAGWYGGHVASGYDKVRSFGMDTDKYVSVAFADDVSVSLKILGIKNGSVRINGILYKEGDEYKFPIEEYVVLEAIADNGFKFLGWSGDRVDTDSKILFQVDTDMEVMPVFADPNGVAILSISPISATGNTVSYIVKRGGSKLFETPVVLKDSFNILYSDGEGKALEEGDEIELTANPGVGFIKNDADWTGTVGSSGLTQKFVMGKESKSITVNFKLEVLELTVKVIRKYVDQAGVIQTEADSTSSPTYVDGGTGNDKWGFIYNKGFDKTERFNNNSFAENKFQNNYGESLTVEAVAGTYYDISTIKIGGVIQTVPPTKVTLTMTASTTVEIILLRKQNDITLNIINGHTSANSQYYTSKVKVSGTGISDGDYLASTTSHNIKALAGLTINFSSGASELSIVHTLTSMTPAIINSIKGSEIVTARFLPGSGRGIEPSASITPDGRKWYKISNILEIMWVADQANNKNNTFANEVLEVINDINMEGDNLPFRGIKKLSGELTGNFGRSLANSSIPVGAGILQKELYNIYITNSGNSGSFIDTLENGLLLWIGISGTNITSVNYSGGIAYRLVNSTIERCYREGFVKGGYSAGGITSSIDANSKIIATMNLARIETSTSAGGISPFSYGVVSNCYNAGILKSGYIGGITYENRGVICLSINIGEVIATSEKYGLSRINTNPFRDAVYFKGANTGDINYDVNSMTIGNSSGGYSRNMSEFANTSLWNTGWVGNNDAWENKTGLGPASIHTSKSVPSRVVLRGVGPTRAGYR